MLERESPVTPPPPPSTESGLEFSIPQDDDVLPAMVVGRIRSTAIMAPSHCYIIQEERDEREGQRGWKGLLPQSEGWLAPRGMNLGEAVSLSSGEGERSEPEVPGELMKWKKAARTPPLPPPFPIQTRMVRADDRAGW